MNTLDGFDEVVQKVAQVITTDNRTKQAYSHTVSFPGTCKQFNLFFCAAYTKMYYMYIYYAALYIYKFDRQCRIYKDFYINFHQIRIINEDFYVLTRGRGLAGGAGCLPTSP